MIEYKVYECEYCGTGHETREKAMECECGCLGITMKHLVDYYDMKWRVDMWKAILKTTGDSHDSDRLQLAIAEQEEFEREYLIRI